FAPDQRRAAAELARVTRPDGRVAVAAWTPGSNAVQMRQALQPFMTPAPTLPPSPPPSPFVWGTHEWLRAAFGGNFRVTSEGGDGNEPLPIGRGGMGDLCRRLRPGSRCC